MTATSPRKMLRNRRHARGFSLIELGIVIAVIAVLASVVIFGRGFIASGRITKAVEAMDTIKKGASTYAGLQGGSLTQSTVNEMVPLAQRQLLPTVVATTGDWYVSGSAAAPADAIHILNVAYDQVGQTPTSAKANSVAITVKAPSIPMAQDIYNSVQNDPNFIKGATIAGKACAAVAPATDTVICCFSL